MRRGRGPFRLFHSLWAQCLTDTRRPHLEQNQNHSLSYLVGKRWFFFFDIQSTDFLSHAATSEPQIAVMYDKAFLKEHRKLNMDFDVDVWRERTSDRGWLKWAKLSRSTADSRPRHSPVCSLATLQNTFCCLCSCSWSEENSIKGGCREEQGELFVLACRRHTNSRGTCVFQLDILFNVWPQHASFANASFKISYLFPLIQVALP